MMRRENALAIGVVATLMAVYIAGAAWSAAIQDTARDVYYAYSIRHGLWFPMQGPVLGGAVHLGPAWFYLMAFALLFSDGWLAIALFAALLASLKFPLAYALGKRCVDARFGLLWACALALPGWSTFEQLIFFNPNPAAACVLGALLLWLRSLERNSLRLAFGMGLLLALSLHVHPTCAPLMALGVHAVWRAPRRVALAIAMLIGFFLPFVPYVAHEFVAGAPDAASAARYMKDQVSAFQAVNAPLVLGAWFAAGPQAIAGYLWKAPLAVSIACGIAASLPAAAAIMALATHRMPGPARAAAIGLAAGCVVFAVVPAVLRPTTPWYFVYALAPFGAGLIASGLWLRLRAAAPAALASACVAIVAIHACVSWQVASLVRSGEGQLSSRILDVKQWRGKQVYADTWYPAAGRASLGTFLCSSGNVSALHGHLAFIEDRSVGVDALFACGTRANLLLMGADPAAAHWVGMSRAFWSRLDAAPECWSGSLGIATAAAVAWPAQGIGIADGRAYFPRQTSRSQPHATTVRFQAAPGQALLISNPLLGYEAMADVQAAADERPVAPLATNDLSRLFVAPEGGGVVTWTLTFSASSPESIDVVLLDRTRSRHPGECASWKKTQR